MSARTVRVAAAQFGTTRDVDENLDTCVRMIKAASSDQPALIVLPEFVNHLSVYEDADHCRSVAVDIDGPFVRACASAARAAGSYVALTPTVRRADRVTVTSLLLAPDGTIALANDKQVLMGNERVHLQVGPSFGNTAETEFGTVGSYACMDGVMCEVPRALVQQGAVVLTNSLNSFARDEASLHIPVRALENQVFVVAANKVGPLLPPDQVEAFARALGIGEDAFEGAGESQIVGPDGTVIAIGPLHGEAVVTADIDLDHVERVRRETPDVERRPSCYVPLSSGTEMQPSESADDELTVSALRDIADLDSAIAAGATLVVAPECSEIPPGLPTSVTVVSSRIDGAAHVGFAQCGDWLLGEQRQMHPTTRLTDVTDLADAVITIDGPWGRLALAVGDDIRVPEYGRLVAVAGANVLAVCHHPVRDVDVTLGLVERAAENRLVIVAASNAGTVDGTVAIDLPADSLWNPNRSAPYDGTINHPRLTRTGTGPVVDAVHPRRPLAREISRGTNLVDGRPQVVAELLTRS